MAIAEEGRGVVLAYADGYPRVIALLRTARRYAQRVKLPWVVIHCENSNRHVDKEEHVRMLQVVTMAEEMGATVEMVPARTPVEAVRIFAEKQHHDGVPVKMVFVADVERHGLFAHAAPSFAQRLKKILPCPVEGVPMENVAPKPSSGGWSFLKEVRVHELFYALAAVVVATLFIEFVNYLMPEAFGAFLRNRRAAYLIAVAFVAGRFGLMPGLTTAVAGFLTMNFLYVDSSFGTLLHDAADMVDLGLFVAGALIIGLVVNRNRLTQEQNNDQVRRMQALFRMYHVSLRAHTYQKTLDALHQELSTALKTEVLFFLPAPFNVERIEAAQPQSPELSAEDKAALELCWAEAKVTGFGTSYHQASFYRFKPLVTPTAAIGVLAIRMDRKTVGDESYRRLLSAIADSVAMILERVTMGQTMEEIRLREEREKLRAMLLSSVSHDLKTPLASVIGSLSVYRSIAPQLPEEQRIMLIQTALEEAQRLDSFITNILDMTRLESGQITFKEEWIRPSELMRSVAKRLRERLHHHKLVVQENDPEDIEVCMDIMMTGQVMQNILDNAAKYTPHGTRIEVGWGAKNGHFQFHIHDKGPGIPEGQLEKVFDKYARIKRQDSQVAGTGLGLAIARTIVRAQGGDIIASNHAEGGAIFTVVLPKYRTVESQNTQEAA